MGPCCGCPGEKTIVPNYDGNGSSGDVYNMCYRQLHKDTKTGPLMGEYENYLGWHCAPGAQGPLALQATGVQGPSAILGGGGGGA